MGPILVMMFAMDLTLPGNVSFGRLAALALSSKLWASWQQPEKPIFLSRATNGGQPFKSAVHTQCKGNLQSLLETAGRLTLLASCVALMSKAAIPPERRPKESNRAKKKVKEKAGSSSGTVAKRT